MPLSPDNIFNIREAIKVTFKIGLENDEPALAKEKLGELISALLAKEFDSTNETLMLFSDMLTNPLACFKTLEIQTQEANEAKYLAKSALYNSILSYVKDNKITDFDKNLSRLKENLQSEYGKLPDKIQSRIIKTNFSLQNGLDALRIAATFALVFFSVRVTQLFLMLSKNQHDTESFRLIIEETQQKIDLARKTHSELTKKLLELNTNFMLSQLPKQADINTKVEELINTLPLLSEKIAAETESIRVMKQRKSELTSTNELAGGHASLFNLVEPLYQNQRFQQLNEFIDENATVIEMALFFIFATALALYAKKHIISTTLFSRPRLATPPQELPKDEDLNPN